MNLEQITVLEWLANSETGMSSETMAYFLGFGIKKKFHSHPYDPDDFDRCLRLLEKAPHLRGKIQEMSGISKYWERLVAKWEDIENMHIKEVGLGWTKAKSAPKTYKMMCDVLKD